MYYVILIYQFSPDTNLSFTHLHTHSICRGQTLHNPRIGTLAHTHRMYGSDRSKRARADRNCSKRAGFPKSASPPLEAMASSRRVISSESPMTFRCSFAMSSAQARCVSRSSHNSESVDSAAHHSPANVPTSQPEAA